MTLTAEDELQPLVVAWARSAHGVSPLPEGFEADVAALLFSRPDLLAYARSEKSRLEASGPRVLKDHDHESRVRHGAIEAVLACYEEGSR